MRVPSSSKEATYCAHREKSHAPDSSRGRGGRRGRGRRNFRERGADNLTNLIFIAHIAINMGMMHPNAGHLGIKLSGKEIKTKVKLMTKTKVKHLNPLIMF